MLCVHCEPRKAGVKFFVCATYLANKDDSDSDSDSDTEPSIKLTVTLTPLLDWSITTYSSEYINIINIY